MKIKDLKSGDIVIFKIYCDILKHEDYQDGNVLGIDNENKIISVIYLEGYKSKYDNIPFSKMIAKFDKQGEVMTFGSLTGTSVLLEE